MRIIGDLIKEIEIKTPKRVWLFRVAYLELLNYYLNYAKASVEIQQEYIDKATEFVSNNENVPGDIYQKQHSAGIATYNHMRVCLRACKVLTQNALQGNRSDELGNKLQEYRKTKGSFANKIIESRNLVGAHPDEPQQIITGANRWGTYGEIHFGVVDLESLKIVENHKHASLNPKEDLERLSEYIEGLIPLIKNCWS